jgi:hypothetical protein
MQGMELRVQLPLRTRGGGQMSLSSDEVSDRLVDQFGGRAPRLQDGSLDLHAIVKATIGILVEEGMLQVVEVAE